MLVVADNQASITDQQLIQQCQSGNRDSFRQLYRRYQQRVRATLYQLCGGSLLDDLVQEVFLRVWKGLPKLRESNHFSSWLYRITWNVAQDQRRRYAQKTESLSLEMEDNDERSLINLNSNSDLMQLHYQDLVQRGLQSLVWEQRVVLVLHDLEDLPQKEIAEILQIPVGTVKSRLFNARKSLKIFLQQQEAIL